MATGTDEPTLTVDELAARAGVTVRTVRFYSTRGLLPPPVIGPRRVGHYGPDHLSRLALIEELQHQGMTLAAIERYLEQLPPDLSAARSGDPPGAGGVLGAGRGGGRDPGGAGAAGGAGAGGAGGGPAGGDGGAGAAGGGRRGFRVDPGLLRLGVELLDVPIAHETILAARTVLLEHTRAAAQELTRLFRDEVWNALPGAGVGDPEHVAAMKSLSAHMQPMWCRRW